MNEFLRSVINILSENSIEGYALRAVLIIVGNIVVARIIASILWRAAVSARRIRPISTQRQATLRYLVRSLMNGLAVIVALVMILAMFVNPASLLTALGLFSAALGLGARPFVSDFLGGLVLVFEDQFALGEKVELGDRQVVGVVERVSLRTTHIRGEAGELWIVPNGDVRTIRNFSRGNFSPANLQVTIATHHVPTVLAIFDKLAAEPGEHVLQTPEIISPEGHLGSETTLLFKVQARHGHAPEVRRRLIEQLTAALHKQGVIGAVK